MPYNLNIYNIIKQILTTDNILIKPLFTSLSLDEFKNINFFKDVFYLNFCTIFLLQYQPYMASINLFAGNKTNWAREPGPIINNDLNQFTIRYNRPLPM